jgi:hypothetical protein
VLESGFFSLDVTQHSYADVITILR